jgi:tetratricopeptide (TPR) repeat protein
MTLAACFGWYEGFARDYTYQAGFTSSHLFIGRAHQNKQIQKNAVQDEGLVSQSLSAVEKLRNDIALQRDLSLRSISTTKKKISKSLENLQSITSEEIKREPEKAKPLINQATALIERKQRQNFATELLQRAYSLDPLDPVLLRKLGAAEIRTRQYEAALKRFAVALRIEPTKPETWLGYGDAMAMQPVGAASEVEPIESAVQAHLAGYWFSLDRSELIRRLNTEPRPFTTERNTKMDLSAKLALHRIAKVDSQITDTLPPLPDLSAFKDFAQKFLEYSEKNMNRQSYEEARAYALNTLAISPDNKDATRILRSIESIERGEKPEGPSAWSRFKKWIKNIF